MIIDFSYAPRARWSAAKSFSAPIGKDMNNRNRLLWIDAGTQIMIRAASGESWPSDLLIDSVVRPTNFTSTSVWMDTSWVSQRWLQQNFNFGGNSTNEVYTLSRFGNSYSCTGVKRLLTSDDMMLEVGAAMSRGETDGMMCEVHYKGGGSTHLGMGTAFEIFRMLQRAGFYSSAVESIPEGQIFRNLCSDFAGLIVVDNGHDWSHLRKTIHREITIMHGEQKTVLICENEEEFFMHKLAMSGPLFLHREGQHAYAV